jgi:hypothetical protein
VAPNSKSCNPTSFASNIAAFKLLYDVSKADASKPALIQIYSPIAFLISSAEPSTPLKKLLNSYSFS